MFIVSGRRVKVLFKTKMTIPNTMQKYFLLRKSLSLSVSHKYTFTFLSIKNRFRCMELPG